jgi:thiamine biosynthesis lipoprotein
MPCSRRRLKRARPLLGTLVEIAVEASAPESALLAMITLGFEAVAQTERLMSYHRPESDLSRLNRARAGERVPVHPWTLRVLAASNELFRRSRGVFDIRCGGALVRAGVLPGPRGAASMPRQADAAPPVELSAGAAVKTGPWTLDLGGIAKGFAVDQAVAAIKSAAQGLRCSGSVNAGGDLRVWGAAASPVEVHGLEGPESARVMRLRSAAVATSAIRDEKATRETPAGHVRHGKLVGRRAAATVIARTCLEADALAKVALLSDGRTATACLKLYGAKALVARARNASSRIIG